MDPRGSIEQARRVVVGAGRLEEESEFRSVLAGLACTRLQWGGLLGIVGVLILVPVNVGLLGRPVAWWYPGSRAAEVFVLWDKALVTLLCAAAVWPGRTRGRTWRPPWGTENPSSFSRLFRETFGCSPTEYAAQEALEDPDMDS